MILPDYLQAWVGVLLLLQPAFLLKELYKGCSGPQSPTPLGYYKKIP